MAITDAAWPVRVLGPTDLRAAAALALEAGWNQVEADWRIFLELGHVMGVDVPGRGVVATAATLPLGPELGWIGMMLVRTPFRRQGLGRQLLGQCILDLAAQGLTPGLDATAAGRELYQRYEFHDAWAITRWRRERAAAPPALPEPAVEVRTATAADLDLIAALDRRAFGYERRSVLARLLERAPRLAALALRRGEPCGFLLARDGREALQLGPLVATDAAAPAALVAHAVAAPVRGRLPRSPRPPPGSARLARDARLRAATALHAHAVSSRRAGRRCAACVRDRRAGARLR